MATPEALAEFRPLCSDPDLKTEAGREFVTLPGLKIPLCESIVVRDALLTLQEHSGYTSRLFLSEPIPGRGANRTTHTVLGRAWHTPSWNNVMPGRPIEMLLSHLGVYR